MASWSVALRLDRYKPSARVVPDSPGNGSNYKDFFDETNRRFKSGIVAITVTSVTLSDNNAGPTSTPYYTSGSGATYTPGETLGLAVQPPNYDPNTDTQFLDSGKAVAAGAVAYTKGYNSGNSIYENYCAINYGRPGPSAYIGSDGTIQYAGIDLTLASNALTDIGSAFTATIAGTMAFTEISPYADIGSVGGGSYSLPLCSGPLASQLFLSSGYLGRWGSMQFPVITGGKATGFASVAIQLQKITSVYFPGSTGGQPVLQVTNPAGQPLARWNVPLPQEAQVTNTLADLYTAVFAANANLIDGNAVQVGSVDVGVAGSTAYSLLNAGIIMPPGSDCSAAVIIDYKIAKA